MGFNDLGLSKVVLNYLNSCVGVFCFNLLGADNGFSWRIGSQALFGGDSLRFDANCLKCGFLLFILFAEAFGLEFLLLLVSLLSGKDAFRNLKRLLKQIEVELGEHFGGRR